MTDMILERFAYSPFGTFGRLKGYGMECFTVERPWDGNKSDVSCIPEGIYTCKRVDSPKFGPGMFEVQRVPHRSHVLIHWGNTMHDVEGCIALGAKLGELGGLWAVLGSRVGAGAAYPIFAKALDGVEEFTLDIRGYRPAYP